MRAVPLGPVHTSPDAQPTVLPISPTDVSQFIRLDQCERYLRLRLHERAEGTRFLRDYGVVPQAIPPLLTRSGADFERAVEDAIGRHSPTVDLRRQAQRQAAGRAPTTTTGVAELARALPPGGVVVLFQPRLQVELDGWRLRGDVDILRLERDADGALHVLIADMKSSTAAKVEHRLQVAFYHEMLAALFAAATASPRDRSSWPSSTAGRPTGDRGERRRTRRARRAARATPSAASARATRLLEIGRRPGGLPRRGPRPGHRPAVDGAARRSRPPSTTSPST